MQIAIIGSGISGLTAAYRLHARHGVTLFEAGDYAGGHTNTVDVELEEPVAGGTERRRYAVDTGFLVCNDRTYPNFRRMLAELEVRTLPTAMSFSVRADAANWEYEGSSLGGLFAQRRNLLRPAFYRMLRDILRFNRRGPAWAAEAAERETVGEFLARHRFSREFADYYLLPMGSAIWSCPVGTFAEFPIRFIVEFYRNHGLLDLVDRPVWHVIEGGSRTYVEAMTRGFRSSIRLRAKVRRIRRDDEGVEIAWEDAAGRVSTARFDGVVIACHADQALAMLDDPTAAEREILAAFPYERNSAVLHTDERLLPRRRRAWAAWNYLLLGKSDGKSDGRTAGEQPGSEEAPRAATVTYNLNILQHLRSAHTLCVSLNVDDFIDPTRILRRFTYHHPVFTVERAAMQERRGEISGVNRTAYCGAYWGNGFHEDGVVSAMRACDAVEQICRRTDAVARS
jgi:predicted NAD/FAD-binding protein